MNPRHILDDLSPHERERLKRHIGRNEDRVKLEQYEIQQWISDPAKMQTRHTRLAKLLQETVVTGLSIVDERTYNKKER